MIKYVLATSIFIMSSSCGIYAGNIFGTQRNDPVEQVGQEITSYLQKLNLSMTTREQFEQQVQDTLNQNIRDSKQFPLFNKLINQDGFKKDAGLQKRLGETMATIAIKFIDEKTKELSK